MCGVRADDHNVIGCFKIFEGLFKLHDVIHSTTSFKEGSAIRYRVLQVFRHGNERAD